MTGMVLLVFCGWAVLLPLSVQSYENLALHKPAWQSSTFSFNTKAERAVDDRYTDQDLYGGQCAVSGWYQTTAEWRVDLGGVKNVHHVLLQHSIVIWWNADFLGFSVYISNTTNKEDGVLCFRDTNYTRDTIPYPVNITCPYHGRYVIYYNNRTHTPYPEGYKPYTMIGLCEVEVYDCPSPGYYGENCSLECPQNCQDGYCESVEGTCFACKPGHIGPRCTQGCSDGQYGYNCVENCSITCGDNCDKITGQCIGGCRAGWTGDMCKTECVGGLFGNNCVENCSITCGDPGICDKVTGHCVDCLPGWEGDMCQNECTKGFYGPNCVRKCSLNCVRPGECDRMTGHCDGGCQPGWTGVRCEEG
uniref:Laminin subunit alpha-2-like isoform X2 n=1 Tax=Crassostrea virginica TaxID=6565 RepID=A0A8B8BKS4_CRAVI|nr:laminin subunit alpha-2-like isoform X2 [Crassostrea virginica]